MMDIKARAIERAILRHLESLRIRTEDHQGEPVFHVVRYFEADVAITTLVSIEALARDLAGE
jgi:hypothetical protein